MYRLFSEMSRSVKRNADWRYYTVGKQYSIETYATIFKVAIKYKEVIYKTNNSRSIIFVSAVGPVVIPQLIK